ncbi:uncharacterized protein LOC142802720 isoform X2 [Rhipicephalus microplus]|uniref:uncharacterized protein LOC142802720 isoform X2 n=1 Tax=Rhipicephalus microplus TaxID=6941 RepID=UPI003F6BEBD1
MGSPIKSDQLRPCVDPSIFVDEQHASDAPKEYLLKRPKASRDSNPRPAGQQPSTLATRPPRRGYQVILGCLLLGGTTILHTSKPNHSSETDQDEFAAVAVFKVAPGLACDLGQAVETSPKPACETNNGTEKTVQVQLLMHHEGSQTDEKKILSSTAMQTEPYTCSSGGVL